MKDREGGLKKEGKKRMKIAWKTAESKNKTLDAMSKINWCDNHLSATDTVDVLWRMLYSDHSTLVPTVYLSFFHNQDRQQNEKCLSASWMPESLFCLYIHMLNFTCSEKNIKWTTSATADF